MNELLTDWQYVVRRVRNNPIFLHPDGTVSSALFKDSQGVSVDKDHERSLDEVISDEERLHQFYNTAEKQKNNPGLKLLALVSVSRGICEGNSIEVIDDPRPENMHHCLLYKNPEKEQLSSKQAKALSSAASIIKNYDST